MSFISKKILSPAEKQAREKDYTDWVEKKRSKSLFSFLSGYSKFAVIVFFAAILIVRFVSLEKIYILFPIFSLLHLLILFLFPAYFSFCPAYGKSKGEFEGFSACTFLFAPAIFPLFYMWNYAPVSLWLTAIPVSAVIFALLALRYKREVRARVSGSIVVEYVLTALAVVGVLVMIGFLTAPHHQISSEPMTVIEKSEDDDNYILKLSDADGVEDAYYVTKEVYEASAADATVYLETYEGLFGVRFVKIGWVPKEASAPPLAFARLKNG